MFGLILRLRKLELESDIILHMIHVSGKRMIASENDALSRGDTTKGVMKGNCLLSHFLFRLGAEQRSTELFPWINSWWLREEPLVHLSLNGWFDNVLLRGITCGHRLRQQLKQQLSSCTGIIICGKRVCMMFAFLA